jgi:hypothetical protein
MVIDFSKGLIIGSANLLIMPVQTKEGEKICFGMTSGKKSDNTSHFFHGFISA